MGKQRRDDQAVDAFSGPKELLKAARNRAQEKRMTKSGYYRYCVAKEIGLPEEQCLRVAEHASLQRMYRKNEDKESIVPQQTRVVNYKRAKKVNSA